MTSDEDKPTQAILVIDGDVVSRHVISDYLRHCGYSVIEAANTNEAYQALGEPSMSIDIILLAIVGLDTKLGFELAQWVRANRPELEVKMAGGVEVAAQTAADICDSGPHLKRPYEPELVVDYIKRLLSKRLL